MRPKRCARSRRAVRVAALGLPQRLLVVHDALHARPVALEQAAVARVAPHLGHGVQVLAVAVVLGNGIGAAPVDAARHLAGLEDVAREPVDELARRFRLAQAQQRRDHHRAVAHPRAGIGARGGTQGRAVARQQHVRERGAQRVGDRLRLRRHAQPHAVEPVAPLRGGRGDAPVELGRAGGTGGAGRPGAERRRPADHRLGVRREADAELQQRRGMALRVVLLVRAPGPRPATRAPARRRRAARPRR